jgi:protein TonB
MSALLAAPARWSTGLILALAVHASIAAALLTHWRDNRERLAGAPAILVDFAPAPAAPAVTPTELPPGTPRSQAAAAPTQAKPTPQKDETVTPKNVNPNPTPQISKAVELQPAPAQTTDVLPLPRPAHIYEAKKPTHRRASEASAPSTSRREAPRAVARAPGPHTNDPDALPNWKSSLLARLERYKRYPLQAQARGDEGVVRLAFSVDRRGGVHNAHIVRSSGSALLDRATLDLIGRAQPLPPPPPGLARGSIPVVVPIRYHIR